MLALMFATLAHGCQEIDTLLMEGDVLPWGAQVLKVNSAAIADTKDWVANIYITGPTESNNVSIRNGELIFQEDSAWGAPPGTTATGGGSVNITNDGKAAIFATFDDPSPGCCADAIWLDPELLVVTGDPVLTPDLPSGSTWQLFDTPKVTWLPHVLMSASFTVPGLGILYAMVIVSQDPMLGLPKTKIRLKEGDLLRGLPSPIKYTSPHALGADGRVLFTVNYSDNPAEVALYRNSRLLAITDGASPIPGVTWESHGVADMNDPGHVAFYGRLHEPPEVVLVKDGEVLVALLDVLPDIAPYHLVTIDDHSVRIGNTGQVLWKGAWDEPWSGYPEPYPLGLFLDERLLVRNGATTAQGAVIQSLQYQHLSRSGRYVAFNATLEGDKSGLFVIDLLSSVTEVTGCLGKNQARLSVESGMPVVGSDLTLALDGAQAAGAIGLIGLSTSEPADPCGVAVAGVGELLLGDPLQVWNVGAWSGNPLSVSLQVPDSLAFVGTVVRAQGAFVDAAPGAAEPVRLSDALALRVGTF